MSVSDHYNNKHQQTAHVFSVNSAEVGKKANSALLTFNVTRHGGFMFTFALWGFSEKPRRRCCCCDGGSEAWWVHCLLLIDCGPLGHFKCSDKAIMRAEKAYKSAAGRWICLDTGLHVGRYTAIIM